MNKSNALHGDEPDEPPIDWNSQTTSVILRSCISTCKTSPILLGLIGRLNHRADNNCGVYVYTSDYQLEYIYDSVPDPYNTPIKSTDDD